MIEYSNLFYDAVKKLECAGFDNPPLDCKRLIDYCTKNNVYMDVQKSFLDKYDAQVFQFALRRRLSHEPVSHIIGHRNFWKSSFIVNQSVLDPRPETELIVQKVLDIPSNDLSLLDLGTGTGCLAISIALERPDFSIYATDISFDSLRIAKANAKNLRAEVKFVQSDWFSNIKHKFDIVISNPPYIRKVDLSSLPLSVQRFEPEIALNAGEEGIDCIKEIVMKLKNHLNPGGIGIFEIGTNQKEMIRKLFNSNGFRQVTFFVDLSGKDRVVCVKKDA